HYPKQVKLRDGREVTVRIMDPADKAKILEFARSLPEDDLLFLRTDITDATVIDGWIDNLKKGNTVTLLAEAENKIAGYASVHREQARWTRRVGEIRMIASPRFRGAGLGRALAAEIFQLARGLGLKKISAMMTTDQTGARTAFERLGFHVEAHLADWVEDRRGNPRDVLMMTYDVAGFTDQAAA
ncbi:MAG: GNAT family N-acetyltransferase, partial [Candidatus Binataceae bacterium]